MIDITNDPYGSSDRWHRVLDLKELLQIMYFDVNHFEGFHVTDNIFTVKDRIELYQSSAYRKARLIFDEMDKSEVGEVAAILALQFMTVMADIVMHEDDTVEDC